MRTLLTLALLLSLTLFTATAVARATPADATVAAPDISVTGEGVAHGAPDVARLRLGVEVFGPSVAPADADAEVDQRISSVVRTLRSAGIPEAHIRTVGLSIHA